MKKLLVFLFLLPVFCFSQIPDSLPNTYINDFAKVLTESQIHNLNEQIEGIEQKSSVQIAVVLVNNLPENIQIEDYAREIGRKWHVGNANNGLVYVAVIQERKQRLEVADKLQGDIPDIAALQITDRVKPYFRQQDYFGGIQNILSDISERIDPVLKEQKKLAAIEEDKRSKKVWASIKNFFLWFFPFGGIIGLFWFRYFKKRRLLREAKEEAERKQQEVEDQLSERIRRAELVARQEKQRLYELDHPKPVLTADQIYNQRQKERLKKKGTNTAPPPVPPPVDSSSYTSSSNNSSSSNNNYGNWGSGSSGSDSSSGFSGGGASNDW